MMRRARGPLSDWPVPDEKLGFLGMTVLAEGAPALPVCGIAGESFGEYLNVTFGGNWRTGAPPPMDALPFGENDRGPEGAMKLGGDPLMVAGGFANVGLPRICGATPPLIWMLPPEGNPPPERGPNDGPLLNPGDGAILIPGAWLGADIGADGGADLIPCSLDRPPRSFDCPCAGEPTNRAKAVVRPIKAPLQFICFFSIVNICSLPFFPQWHPPNRNQIQ
jgi:hypothetical protein